MSYENGQLTTKAWAISYIFQQSTNPKLTTRKTIFMTNTHNHVQMM